MRRIVTYWNRFIQTDSIYWLSAPHQVSPNVCESLLKAFENVLNKRKEKKSLNEFWIIPGANGSITARLSPRSSIWFISSPPCFSAIRGITGLNAPILWRYVPAASCFLKYIKLYEVINVRIVLISVDWICQYMMIFSRDVWQLKEYQMSINSSIRFTLRRNAACSSYKL